MINEKDKHMGRKITLALFFLLTLSAFGQNNPYIEIGFDPKMITNGPYEGADSALDMMVKVGIHGKRLDYNFYTEVFNATRYYSYGIGMMIPYRLYPPESQNRTTSLDFAFGFDVGLISRPELNSTTGSFGLNLETRFNIGKSFTLKYLANWRYRSDLVNVYNEQNNFKFGGYLSLVYNFHK